MPMHLQKWQKLFAIHVESSAIGQPLLRAIHILMELGARTILLGVQNFLRRVFRDAGTGMGSPAFGIGCRSRR